MENQEEENMLPPFWLQTSNTHQQTNIHRRRLRLSSSILFSSGALIMFLLVIAFAFIFIIIPTVQSFTSQIFKPQLVKKSWDSLNLILVLFAIVCGFLSRNTNTENNTSSYVGYQSVSNGSQQTQKSNPAIPHQWHNQFSEQNGYNKSFRRLRSSSSHPDLRQETFLSNMDERWRFYDDTHVTNFRLFDSDELHYRRPWQEFDKDESLETKTIEVDTFLVKAEEEDSQTSTPPARTQYPHPPPPPPPPPPPRLPQTPPKVVKRVQKRTHHVIAQKEEIAENQERNDLEIRVETFQNPPPRYNSLPPPVPLVYEEVVHHKSSAKNERNRGGAKEFLTSLKRKKKQRQKSVENFETILNKFYSSSTSAPLALHPPPPSSPPPPSPSVFHNLFTSKKAKAKKLYLRSQASDAHPPTPPPPPPKRPITQTVSKSKTYLSKPISEHKHPLPTSSRVANVDNSPKSGSESSLIPIPPPPPPPPFKIPELKFVKYGDFVRLKSNGSSRSSSPDLDEGGEDSASDRTMSPLANGIGMEGRESPSPIFCSSPDVNTKADTFIARFRAGLKSEKVDSMEKQHARLKSNLGPRSSLGQE